MTEFYIFVALTVVLTVFTIISIHQNASRIANGFAFMGIIFCLYEVINKGYSLFFINLDADWLKYFLFALVIAYVIFVGYLGIRLIINGISCMRKEGFSIAHVLPCGFGFGMVFVCTQHIYDMFSGMSGNDYYVFALTALFYMCSFFPLALGGFFFSNIFYRHFGKKAQNPGYIIILGCAERKDGTPTPLLKGRIDKAIEEWNKFDKKPCFIVSGGKGSDELISEAECMKNYLVSQGVAEDKIILEDKSTTTDENLTFSKALVPEGSEFLIATSSYHVLRAKRLADKKGMNAQAVGAKTAKHYYTAASLREYIAFTMNNKPALLIYPVICIILAAFEVLMPLN